MSLILSYNTFIYSKEDKFPQPTGYINDFANIIDTKYENYLERLTRNVEKKVGIEIVIVSIKSLKEEAIEEYAVALFEEWKIGKKGKDDGLLLLIAPKERKVRIEVGYGLEAILPDSLCGMIIDEVMIPYFKRGNYSQGVVAALVYIAEVIEKEYKVKISVEDSGVSSSQPRHERTGKRSILGTLFLLLLFTLFLSTRIGLPGLLLYGFLSSSGYWRSGGYYGGSGGFSGGFGGFGGGSSGGGGASGSW